MPIVATAGHVDHGKSTLVEGLTGRDPDRWAEEKARGLTIDLGFAWARIGEIDVGFVDVPGHERFIKNMLAGVGAVDVALFVVAADEGWMPQSEEHLAILDLLDTRYGVIALSRIDLVDEETADTTELDVLEAIERTSLAEWPIVRVSPITGTGMDLLRNTLAEQLATAGEPSDVGRPRLWVDRSFTITGAGLVVTGTLAGGGLATGDTMELWPGAVAVRIRGLQRHGAEVSELTPGSRAALNITGAERVERGAMLGAPGAFRATTRFLATLRTVRNLGAELTSRGAFHLHVGSGSWPAQLRVIEAATDPVVLLRTSDPVPIHTGDRLILRETGRRAVVAGGSVLDPHPAQDGARVRASIRRLTDALGSGPDGIAAALLEVRGTATMQDLRRDSGGGEASSPFRAGDLIMAQDAADRLCDDIVSATDAFHRENRLRPGVPKASLGSALGVDADTVSMVVAGTPELADEGATVRLATFEPGLDADEQQAWEDAQRELARSWAVPRASQLGLGTELLHALIRNEQLVKVGDDLVYLPEQVAAIAALLTELEDEFTVAEFRDHLEVTRRQAVPLLEWFDSQGVTVRRGDVRMVE